MPYIEQTNRIGDITGNVSGPVVVKSVGSPAVSSATAVHAAVTDNGSTQTVTTNITNPDVPRVLTATAGGTSGDVKAIQVTVTGTDANGKVISEALPAFTVNTTGTVTGTKAFKTVTSISIPAHDGNGATTSVGTGAALGIGDTLSCNTVLRAIFNGTVEATAPTVVTNATDMTKNVATLNTTLDGSAIYLIYVRA